MAKFLKRLFCRHKQTKVISDDYGYKRICKKCGKEEDVYMGWV